MLIRIVSIISIVAAKRLYVGNGAAIVNKTIGVTKRYLVDFALLIYLTFQVNVK